MFRIYLTNLGKYNEGELIGKWVNLPCEDFEKELTEIGVSSDPAPNGMYYEEYFITDCESDFGANVSEYANLDKLNELAYRIDALYSYEKEVLQIITDQYTSDLNEALDIVESENYTLMHNVNDDYDLGHYYIHELECLSIPDYIEPYFDYEAYGRDIRISGTFLFSGDTCVEIC